jgi:hypothetical protein
LDQGIESAQVQARLARAARGIGSIVDLRVASRGASHRVTDLEIVGQAARRTFGAVAFVQRSGCGNNSSLSIANMMMLDA